MNVNLISDFKPFRMYGNIYYVGSAKYSVHLINTEAGGEDALRIAVRYLTIMAPCFIIVHILHVFRNVLQAMGVAAWALASGFAEFAARIFMSQLAINWIGTDALFIAEPASWLGAMLCVFLPYFYYRKKYLKG